MSEVRFSPESWDDGARRVSGAAQDFADAANAMLGRVTNLGRLGCNNGGTIADAALGMIFPALCQAVQETVAGLADGLSGEAANMRETGAGYRSIEETNAALAAAITEGA
ncbi:hypothetical protein LKO27_00525 [Tessaracoccus sp. OS52]|uniref:hypothetical protein n=1 Tax=Tessaracoccus sp. OS52 TaxID=2886691 RepID=UPI001D11C150|nr:hypothetical protein [Tessaracoccus sp. OS52]MCC2591915.1 hypothetical protein [Tessaracoccus sp. OS52]